MEIIITRHGQTEWNALKKIQGQKNIDLNDVGRKQAQDVGQLIKNENIDLIITSPLKRARETAQIINKNFEVNIIEDERLKERSYGKNEGLTKDEIRELKEKMPELDEIWNYNKNVGINNIEKIQDFCNRVYDFFDDIIEKYRDKKVLLVTHGGTTTIAKYYFMNIPLEKLIDRKSITGLNNCEIVKFEV